MRRCKTERLIAIEQMQTRLPDIHRAASLRVSEMRFELTQAYAHYPLKVACLPIPPPGQYQNLHLRE